MSINEHEYFFTTIRTSLHTGDTSTLEQLIKKQPQLVNLQEKENLKTALHLSISKGNLSFAEFLLSYGAEPTKKDKNSNLPLSFFFDTVLPVSLQSIRVLCRLLGSDKRNLNTKLTLNLQNNGNKQLQHDHIPILSLACRNCSLWFVEFLLQNGANIKKKCR
eukprot:TRINITY_DN7816_c0_g1_i1.p1 TRINITY_DN7816_c0_g1~~TRINITY_DN7816_c0_g1_i1.p1  ORF type:complete len:162 (-),score=11.89 TRINITY_DN7816_c0_g1_i1:161-646(-)